MQTHTAPYDRLNQLLNHPTQTADEQAAILGTLIFEPLSQVEANAIVSISNDTEFKNHSLSDLFLANAYNIQLEVVKDDQKLSRRLENKALQLFDPGYQQRDPRWLLLRAAAAYDTGKSFTRNPARRQQNYFYALQLLTHVSRNCHGPYQRLADKMIQQFSLLDATNENTRAVHERKTRAQKRKDQRHSLNTILDHLNGKSDSLPERTEALLHLTSDDYPQEDQETLISGLQHAVDKAPAMACALLGQIYLLQGHTNDAVELLTTAFDLGITSVSTLIPEENRSADMQLAAAEMQTAPQPRFDVHAAIARAEAAQAAREQAAAERKMAEQEKRLAWIREQQARPRCPVAPHRNTNWQDGLYVGTACERLEARPVTSTVWR